MYIWYLSLVSGLYRCMMRAATFGQSHSAEGLLQKTLLLGLSEVPVYQVESMVDTASDHRPGKCFLDDHRNPLHAVDGYLLQRNPRLVSRFFLPNASDIDDNDYPAPMHVRQSAVNAYLHTNQLTVLIHWSAYPRTGG